MLRLCKIAVILVILLSVAEGLLAPQIVEALPIYQANVVSIAKDKRITRRA